MANRRSGVKETLDLLLVLCLSGLATTRIAAHQPVFRSTTELVRIPVSVTRGNQPVEPGVLTLADFSVTEDGAAQVPTFVQRESLPLSIAVVYDISGSMGEERPAALGVESLRQVSLRLRAEDEVSLITFAGSPSVAVPWTPAPEAARLSLNLTAKGSTSLVDAVVAALKLLDGARNSRPVVLLVSDGFENSSLAPWRELVTTRRQSEASVYAFTIAPLLRRHPNIGPSSADPATAMGPMIPSVSASPAAVNIIPALVGTSGGVEYRIATGREIPNLARAFVEDLRFQYTIGYSPSKPFDGRYRRVKVEVKKRGYRVRHRVGYLALPGI
jgi:VWFA-related protein